MELILKYFPNLTQKQIDQYELLYNLYVDWNAKINVVSRKDINELYLRHVLHSLGIAKVMSFKSGAQILDLGTGGGFPGIPLSIMFPGCEFHLVDSINKKLKVVKGIADSIGLENVRTSHERAEKLKESYDFVVSRAVTAMPTFVNWVNGKIKAESKNELKNGILYLKGGDLNEELSGFNNITIYNLDNYFKEDFFETKKVVHIPI